MANLGPATGPVAYRQDHELTASIRFLTVYEVGTDQCNTRIDIVTGYEGREPGSWRMGRPGHQMNAALATNDAKSSALFVPSGGIVSSYTFRAAPEDLVRELRSLADLIEAKTVPQPKSTEDKVAAMLYSGSL